MSEVNKTITMLNNARVVLSSTPKNGAGAAVPGVPITYSLGTAPAGGDIVTLELGVPNAQSVTIHGIPGKTGTQNGTATDGNITAPFSVSLQDAAPVSLNLAFGTPTPDI